MFTASYLPTGSEGVLFYSLTIFLNGIAWEVYSVVPIYTGSAAVKLSLAEKVVGCKPNELWYGVNIVLDIIHYLRAIIKRYQQFVVILRLQMFNSRYHSSGLIFTIFCVSHISNNWS